MTDFLSSPVAVALTLTLAHFLWQGLLVAVGYWILLGATGKRSASTRYWTALGALIGMVVCPLLTFVSVYGDTSDAVAASHQTQTVFVQEKPTRLPDSPRTAESASLHRYGQHASEDEAIGGPSHSPGVFSSILSVSRRYILLFWIAGVVLSGARLMAGFVNTVWLRWGQTEIAIELAERSHQIARQIGLKTSRVFSSAYIREAAVVGFWRPVVLLPTSWLTALPMDVLEAIIAHELAHIRRHDVWVNLLQRIAETLLFYHPAVWWLSNRIRLEREMCCDELAVEATGERSNYVIALEQVGRLQVRGTPNLATAFTGDKKMNLLRRVKNVLNTTGKPTREPAWLIGVLAVAIPFLVLGISGLSATQNTAMAQEREGTRSAEAEAGQRRSAESDAPRRSAEADASPRRSAEAEAGARRSAEGERGSRRSPEGEGRGQEGNVLSGFKPETQRERALFQMIVQLQREVAALRREVQSRSGNRAASESRVGNVGRSAADFELPPRWQNTKEGKVFKAYDKNGDEVVTLDEWLAMTNGNISPARREISTGHFNDAEPSGDGKFTPAEFIWWRRIGSKQAAERANQSRARDGEGERRGQPDGEGVVKRGPRDRE